MACSSLRHHGEELLGAVTRPDVPDVPWTRGIPLLHPWANRLGGFGYAFDGVVVALAPARPTSTSRSTACRCTACAPRSRAGRSSSVSEQRLVAGRELTGLPAFPFDHRLEVAAELHAADADADDDAHRDGARPVPIAFGYHPFFRLPGVPRAEWEITLPVRRPPAARRAARADRRARARRRPRRPARRAHVRRRLHARRRCAARSCSRAAAAGSRSPSRRGYPYAQVFAPAIADVICFEPMTAPADALRHSPDAVAPGESFSARFSVSVIGVSQTVCKSADEQCQLDGPPHQADALTYRHERRVHRNSVSNTLPSGLFSSGSSRVGGGHPGALHVLRSLRKDAPHA